MLLSRLNKSRMGRACLKLLPYCLLVAVLLSSIAFSVAADTEESKSIATVAQVSKEISDDLAAAGIACSASDYISEGEHSGVYSLWISPSSTVRVICSGVTNTLTSYGETVGALLSRLKLTVGEHDFLIVGRPAPSGPFTITLVRRTVEQLICEEPIARPVTRIPSDELYQTQEKVAEEGSDGVRLSTYETVTINGSYARRSLSDFEVIAEPTAQIVEYGTRELPALSPLSITTDFLVSVEENGSGGGVITTFSGKQMSYIRVLTVKAYAYTTENKTDKRTAIGTTARVGAIAVDPKVIPYGTRMFIQTVNGNIIYGIATAEDCGNFSGNVVDLYFNTRDECFAFGKRTCTVYILDE